MRYVKCMLPVSIYMCQNQTEMQLPFGRYWAAPGRLPLPTGFVLSQLVQYLSIKPSGTKKSTIFYYISINICSKTMHLRMSSARYLPFLSGLNGSAATEVKVNPEHHWSCTMQKSNKYRVVWALVELMARRLLGMVCNGTRVALFVGIWRITDYEIYLSISNAWCHHWYSVNNISCGTADILSLPTKYILLKYIFLYTTQFRPGLIS